MTEETVVLPALQRFPAPALVPALTVAALILAVATGFFYLQSAHNGEALGEANSQVVTLHDELSKAQQKASTLEAQVAALQQREAEQGVPLPLPVEVTFRAGRPGLGFVARFQNYSAGAIGITVRVSRASGEQREFKLDVPVHGLVEAGHEQGWDFQSGDTLSVQSGNYSPLSYRVP
jgi:hypothetical protein